MLGLRYSLTPSGFLNITSTNFASAAAWNQTTGTLRIPVAISLQQMQLYNLSFVLQNPYFYQASPAINVTVVGPLPMTLFTIVKPANDTHAVPLNVQGVVFSRICQSTPSVLVPNTITVTFSTFLDVTVSAGQSAARDLFTVIGLTGSASRDAVLAITTSASVLPTVGAWTQELGALVVTLSATLKSSTNLSFSFQLLNPSGPQAAPNTSLQIPGCLQQVPQACGTTYNALMVAGFLRVYAFQSTSFPGQPNVITLQITASVTVAAGSLMTLSGLVGSPQAAEHDLPLVGGSNSSYFASTSGAAGSIRWTLPPLAGQNLGACCNVVFSVAQSLAAGVTYTLSFVLTNPAVPQAAPALSIASTLGTLIPGTAVGLGPDKAAPLFVPGFVFANIGQSSPFEGYANSITVTFASSCALEAGTVVVVQLNAALQPSSPALPLADRGNFAAAFGASGAWDAGAMALSLTVGAATQVGVLYAFSFATTNGAVPQPAPSVSIGASGATLLIAPVAMAQAPGYDAAFYTVAVSVDATKACPATVSWSQADASAQWQGRRGLGFIGKGGLTLVDSSVPPFALEAIWIQPSGSLTFFSSAVFLAGVEYVARVHLRNPPGPQASPPAYIETSGFGIYLEPLATNATGVLNFTGSWPGDQQVLKTYDPGQFHSVRIGQSSPFPDAQNTLTLTLVAASTLQDAGGGAQVVLAGLVGTQTPDADALPLALQGAGAAALQGTGQWVQGAGTLVVPLLPGAALPPGEPAVVAFVLQNGVGILGPQVNGDNRVRSGRSSK